MRRDMSVSSKRMADVKRWYLLIGCEENDDTQWHIEKWDHYPSSDEVDAAVTAFTDAKIHTFFLLEEVARGRSSVLLKPVVEQKKLEGPKPKEAYKMPPLHDNYSALERFTRNVSK